MVFSATKERSRKRRHLPHTKKNYPSDLNERAGRHEADDIDRKKWFRKTVLVTLAPYDGIKTRTRKGGKQGRLSEKSLD